MNRRDFVNSHFPAQVVAELTAACNQRCVFCGRTYMERMKKTMDKEIFRKIIKEIAEVSPLTELWPTFMGEALLLKGTTLSLIREAKDIGCQRVTLNSNGSLLDDRLLELIIDSKMDRFIVSMDAFTEETHSRVRPAVNSNKNSEFFQNMWKGTKKLIKMIQERGLSRPLIEVQFSVFDENQHERKDFIDYWLNLGAVVKVRPKMLWTGEVPSNPSEAYYRNVVDGGIGGLDISQDRIPCGWSADTLAITWDGNVVACAVDAAAIGKDFVRANINNTTIKKTWDGKLRELRQLHWQKMFAKLPNPCHSCPDWQTKKSLAYFPDSLMKKEYEDYVTSGPLE